MFRSPCRWAVLDSDLVLRAVPEEASLQQVRAEPSREFGRPLLTDDRAMHL